MQAMETEPPAPLQVEEELGERAEPLQRHHRRWLRRSCWQHFRKRICSLRVRTGLLLRLCRFLRLAKVSGWSRCAVAGL